MQAFKAAFPGVNIKLTVDLSKYQDGRIHQQRASGNVSTDLTFLQTLHDFDRWKAQGALLPSKPAGWAHVPAKFKVADGTDAGLVIFSFSNATATSAEQAPETPRTIWIRSGRARSS